ncbi:MAG: carboxypeptidase-like regulatory domain-containing protein [Anaerolineae bacterium]
MRGEYRQLQINHHLSLVAILSTLLFLAIANLSAVQAQDTTAAPAGVNLPVGVVSGMLINGTAASTVPVGLTVSLFVRDTSGAVVQKTDTVVQADGSYRFEGVPIAAEYEYVSAVQYRDQVFSSPFLNGDTTTLALNLPIQIFELTEDPSVLKISGTSIQVSVVGQTLELQQVFRFSNSSDRLYTTTTATEDGRYPSVLVTLPPGAQVVSFDNPARYIVSQRDFTVLDTAPVPPGDEHLILLVYVLPYDGSPSLIEQTINYPFDGRAKLLISNDGLQVKSDQLQALGDEKVGDQEYHAFGGTFQIRAGDVLRYELSGGAAPAQSTSASTPSNSILLILTGLIGLATIGLAAALFLRRRQNPAVNADKLINALVQQMEGLDRQHASGQLAHDLWHRQRAALQARLNELMGGEPSDT